MNGNPHELTVRYIADPMCAQCYGIAPFMDEVSAYCDRHGLGFSLTMGGLRAGGGVAWIDAFKTFLREEWKDISWVSGMPFDFSLFDLSDFDYDTEPACRAVVVAQQLLANKGLRASAGLAFFKAAQEEFYVRSRDPKEAQSYRPACASVGIDFDEFQSLLPTLEARKATHQQFVQSRLWEVSDFPTLLVAAGGEIIRLAQGFKQATTVLENLVAFARAHGDSGAKP